MTLHHSLPTGPVMAWWRELQPSSEGAGDRATLARLRRCATVAEAMLEPSSIALFRRCGGRSPDELPAIALAAAVLAHVRADERVHPARRVGPDAPEKPETAKLKATRFRWLMEAGTPDERLTAFRRLVAIADRTLNVHELALALLHWDEERQRRWVFEYWNANPIPNAPPKEAAPT